LNWAIWLASSGAAVLGRGNTQDQGGMHRYRHQHSVAQASLITIFRFQVVHLTGLVI
jgi:hypothetical protein